MPAVGPGSQPGRRPQGVMAYLHPEKWSGRARPRNLPPMRPTQFRREGCGKTPSAASAPRGRQRNHNTRSVSGRKESEDRRPGQIAAAPTTRQSESPHPHFESTLPKPAGRRSDQRIILNMRLKRTRFLPISQEKYVTQAFPRISFVSTVPQKRESELSSRLSPIMKR